MSAENLNELDSRLSAALERKPDVQVAPGFAARVAARAAAMPLPKPRRAVSYGQTAGVLSLAILLLTMFLLAPWTQPGFRSIAFDVELCAAAELITLSWWLVGRRRA